MDKKILELGKAVIQKEDKYLLLKREPDAEDYQNLWDFAGGRLDPGETPVDAVIRETYEESALKIIPSSEIKEIKYEEEKRILIFHYFEPKSYEGEFKLSSEHTEYAWFTKEELDKLEVHPSVSEYFKE